MNRYFLAIYLALITLLPLTIFASSTDITTYKFTFSAEDNFTIDFSDYPVSQEKNYELAFKQDISLPKEIHAQHKALRISGNNHSDDLFMYAYKKVDGLKPNTLYHVDFSLEFASNAMQNSTGTGGSPGDSVYVKVGAVSNQPQRYLDDFNTYQINLDKGNQGQDGKDMVLIGTIGVDTENSIYRLKTLPYLPDEAMQAKLANYSILTDAHGQAWVIVGTDSGFESTTTIFYSNLTVTFKEIPK